MTSNFDSKESVTDRPVRLTATELSSLILAGGPAGRLRVRAYSKTSDRTLEGRTAWQTDLAGNQPAFVSYRDEATGDVESVIPIGGHTVVYTQNPSLHPEHGTIVQDNPIHQFAEGWEFEIIEDVPGRS